MLRKPKRRKRVATASWRVKQKQTRDAEAQRIRRAAEENRHFSAALSSPLRLCVERCLFFLATRYCLIPLMSLVRFRPSNPFLSAPPMLAPARAAVAVRRTADLNIAEATWRARG